MHDIAIIGAGIGGLVTALSLQRQGFRPVIYEQARELGEVGAGISLGPNALRILYHLGLGDAIEGAGTLMSEGSTRHYKTDELLTPRRVRGEYERKYGFEYYQFHRADIHKALVAAVRRNDAEALILGHRLFDIEQNDHKVTLSFVDRPHRYAEVVVGADGCRSQVRDLVFGEPAPEFSGYVAYRGLLPMKSVSDISVPEGAALNIGPGAIFMRYKVRNDTLLNCLGVVKSDEWKEEGWNVEVEKRELLSHFADWHRDIRSVISNMADGQVFKWALLHKGALPSFVNGRVVLVGDAAHTISPFLGQGASMAIEDALSLARCHTAFRDVRNAHAAYDRMRVDRSNWVLKESQSQARRMMSLDPENFDASMLQNIRDDLFAYDCVSLPIDGYSA